jgi:hypothetical protein
MLYLSAIEVMRLEKRVVPFIVDDLLRNAKGKNDGYPSSA